MCATAAVVGRSCVVTAMWAGFTLTLRGLRSVLIAVCDPACVGSARRCAYTAMCCKVSASLSVVCCSCVHCRVGVQIRRYGHGFCFRSTWFAARVFIAVFVCRYHGFCSEGLKLGFFRRVLRHVSDSVHLDVESQGGALDGQQLLVVEGSGWRGTLGV